MDCLHVVGVHGGTQCVHDLGQLARRHARLVTLENARVLGRGDVLAEQQLLVQLLPVAQADIFDGDIAFVSGLREGLPSPNEALSVAMATELAVEQAILDAVTA